MSSAIHGSVHLCSDGLESFYAAPLPTLLLNLRQSTAAMSLLNEQACRETLVIYYRCSLVSRAFVFVVPSKGVAIDRMELACSPHLAGPGTGSYSYNGSRSLSLYRSPLLFGFCLSMRFWLARDPITWTPPRHEMQVLGDLPVQSV